MIHNNSCILLCYAMKSFLIYYSSQMYQSIGNFTSDLSYIHISHIFFIYSIDFNQIGKFLKIFVKWNIWSIMISCSEHRRCDTFVWSNWNEQFFLPINLGLIQTNSNDLTFPFWFIWINTSFGYLCVKTRERNIFLVIEIGKIHDLQANNVILWYPIRVYEMTQMSIQF